MRAIYDKLPGTPGYLIGKDRVPGISQNPSAKLSPPIPQKPSEELRAPPIRQKPSGKLFAISAKPSRKSPVPFTLPKEANIFASQYELYLPSKEILRQRLMQWTAE